jgi:hypothetical protein
MEALCPVTRVLKPFGTYRNAQEQLGLSSPYQPWYWAKVGRIPEHYKPRIREAAKRLGVKLPPKAMFDQAFTTEARRAA